MEEDLRLVADCLRSDAKAFDKLYHRFASKMMVVCSRYANGHDQAKDLLQDGFIRVFQQIHTFRGEGSLEGWVRRVIVTVTLTNYHKNSKLNNKLQSIDQSFNDENQPFLNEDISSQIAFEEMLIMIQELPPAYRMVCILQKHIS